MEHLKCQKKPIIFFFDDGWRTVYTDALPIMEQYGFVGSVAVVTDYANKVFGGSSYMNWTELQELKDKGWDMVSHGRNHWNMLKLNETAFRSQLTISRDNISEHLGVVPTQFVFPFHVANQTYTDICGEYYYHCWTWGVSTNDLKYLYKSTDGKLYKGLIRISIANTTTMELFLDLLGRETNIMGEWKMDEGEGVVTLDSSGEGEVHALGGGEKDAMLLGGASWGTDFVAPVCDNGIDDDLDGFIDYMDDFGCESGEDNSEVNDGSTQCSDGLDNDGDSLIDQEDLDCEDRNDTDESTPIPDLLPNVLLSANPLSGDAPLVVEFNCSTSDGDAPFIYNITFGDESFIEFNTSNGFVEVNHTYSSAGNYTSNCNVTDLDGDFDFDSLSIEINEPPVFLCSDGLDNDLDGEIDYPADFGCEDVTDNDEVNNGLTQCSNGLDDDLDGLIDQDDLECLSWDDISEAD